MEKTIKISVPDGNEIDKEKSTFDGVVIKWNAITYAVEIIADGEHFMVDASRPSYCCSWDDAMRFHRNGIWNLPTDKQLQLLLKYFDDINAIIRENGGYEFINGWYWSCEEKDEFCAWNVNMNNGSAGSHLKYDNDYVRAVSSL